MAISVHILDMYYTFGRRSFQKADHPRGCGEHLYSSSFLPYLKGIIPADAGNTDERHWLQTLPTDHPRGCGEHFTESEKNQARQGSSPRMRGTLNEDYAKTNQRRIIPADAGSTWIADPSGPAWQDHPRGCGEHFSSDAFGRFQAGSSPRMRGTRVE